MSGSKQLPQTKQPQVKRRIVLDSSASQLSVRTLRKEIVADFCQMHAVATDQQRRNFELLVDEALLDAFRQRPANECVVVLEDANLRQFGVQIASSRDNTDGPEALSDVLEERRYGRLLMGSSVKALQESGLRVNFFSRLGRNGNGRRIFQLKIAWR